MVCSGEESRAATRDRCLSRTSRAARRHRLSLHQGIVNGSYYKGQCFRTPQLPPTASRSSQTSDPCKDLVAGRAPLPCDQHTSCTQSTHLIGYRGLGMSCSGGAANGFCKVPVVACFAGWVSGGLWVRGARSASNSGDWPSGFIDRPANSLDQGHSPLPTRGRVLVKAGVCAECFIV